MIFDLRKEKNSNTMSSKNSKSGNDFHSDAIRFTMDSLKTHIADLEKIISDLTTENEILREAQQNEKIYASQLELSNHELEEFSYAASHDLQAPLRKIMTFSERLKDKYGDVLDDTGKDYLDRLYKSAQRMQTLITELLKFSRVTTQGGDFTTTDLNEAVSEALADLETQIEQNNGRVDVRPLPTIEADHTQMRQLFQNLIGNALKFHGENPPFIKVYALPDEDTASRLKNGSSERWMKVVVVEDNGIGIDHDYLETVFIPFKRLHGDGEYEGTGIGLAICKKIVKRHGGTIHIESAPGKGSRFFVALPPKRPAIKQDI